MNQEKNENDQISVDYKKEENVGNNSKKFKIAALIALLVIGCVICLYFLVFKDKDGTSSIKQKINPDKKYTAYTLTGNSLENFDLYFLQLENEKENKIYSPLSIKYALEMLNEGANGESKEQISNVIGNYESKKYVDSSNMSFANALFVKDSYKTAIKDSYIDTLSDKFNAAVVYDSFENPDALNSWVSNKTFKLIDSIFDNVSDQDFILVNALAIDMDWVNQIQNEHKDYKVDFAHEDYFKAVWSLVQTYYHDLEFKDVSYKVKSSEIGAVINKYDIVNELGEENIRKNVGEKYEKWLSDGAPNSCGKLEDQIDVNTYLDNYIQEISEGYGHISSSTDFEFFVDDNVKIFAKDLKEYNGTTLQYIGIMPKKDDLNTYIKNVKASDLNALIGNLKAIELDNFKDGVITEISGYIPMFKFDYELKLIDDLKNLGITNVFDSDKADLSNLSNGKAFINKAAHKANIEFSNDGIKAAAATAMGGKGAGDCGFDYLYEVPVEKIDLTFDNPYMFIIRDKNSGEVWFAGTVYEPTEYQRGY